MQSYTSYRVSEFHKDRHPYIPPENQRPLMDPEQVSIAYNERAIPKLADLLVYTGLSSEKRKDALHTLNELVSHQETKVEMINQNIVLSACNLMSDDNPEVRLESALLVGSLLLLEVGRAQFDLRETNYKIMQNLIFDKNLKVRECVGWLLYRFTISKDGLKMIYKNNIIFKMIDAFNLFSACSNIKDNQEYILYLLEAFINISMYDFGIEHMLKKNLLSSFNNILLNRNNEYSDYLTKGVYEQLKELILSTLKNITLIKDGKLEAIKENLIYTVADYLNSPLESERLFSSSFMMTIGSVLEAKNQICNYIPYNGSSNNRYEILEKICLLLEDPDENIQNNTILCLRILSELPSGYLKIIEILYEKLILMDEVFGVKSLNGICELLPKLSKYKNPPHVEIEMLPRYAKYIRGIIYFIKKYPDDSMDILIHETANFVEKLCPFLILNDTKLHKSAKAIINQICSKDPHNAQVFQKFIEIYTEKDKNYSKDGSENNSLHLSDLN